MALSGGPDSTALLHLLCGAAERRGHRVVAAHFDHGLRPGSADEARLVRERASELGVACLVGAPERPLPLAQEALRHARYRFLRDAARKAAAQRIATAHQADDQAETVLFRLLRGGGVRGLGGIPARRGEIVRPLLPFRRDELREWLAGRGIPFLRDPSNADPRWARSRIRHAYLPLLEERLGRDVRGGLRRLGRAAREADAALDRLVRRLAGRSATREAMPAGVGYRLERRELAGWPRTARSRLLRLLARRLGRRLTRGGTRAGAEFISNGRSGAGVDLGGGLRLWREFDVLRLAPSPRHGTEETAVIDRPGAGRAKVTVGGRRLWLSWSPAGSPGESRYGAILPVESLRFPLRVRGWRPGDRIRRPAGSRKLKRLFNDRRVPVSRRHRVPLLVDAGGRVLWVAGIELASGLEGGQTPGARLVVGLTDREET